MIKRSIFEPKSHERKKLIIVDSRSSIYKNNLKNIDQPEGKSKLSAANNFINKSRQNDNKHKTHDLPSLGKENFHFKKSISLQKNSFHSEEKVRPTSIIQLLMGRRRQNTLPNICAAEKGTNICAAEKGTIDRQKTKLKLENISLIPNNESQVVNYSLSSLLKTQKAKPQFDAFDQATSFEYEKETVSPQASFRSKMAPPKNSYYSHKTEMNSQQKCQAISNSNEFRIVKKKEIYNNQNSQKYKCLKLESSLFQIIITPSNPKNGKISVEIQTVQDEKEFFDYLHFKRKRTILQQDLTKAFSFINEIKEDRAVYEQRVSRFLGFVGTKPSNDRQERVFRLKNEILKLEQNVEDIILEKYRAFDDYIKELDKIEDQFLAQNQKFINSIRKQKETYASSLQPVDYQKINNIFTKVQKGLKKHFHESQKKLYEQILKGKTYNDQASELIEVFRDYSKTIKEQKILLKNCFGHIKKIPELCYGLLGDQLPDLTLKKQNDVFILPKCMQCFNSEWKIHVIVEKNQLMQSILKVTDELLK